MDPKRVSARAVIFDGEYVHLMFRRKRQEDGTLKEYYVVPGGGVEEGETLEQTVKRELQEEFSVDINVIQYVGTNETEKYILNFFICEIISGTPTLGGEEKDECNEENYYEPVKIKMSEIDNYDVYSKEFVIKAYEMINN